MEITSITNGIVIDHIKAGKGMELFDILALDEFENSVALIKNAPSKKMGKKDIIKIDGVLELDLDTIAYVAPGATVNVIENGKLVKKPKLELPEKLEGVLKCKNPRCITSVEKLPSIFKLTDRENKVYRCIYCETKAK